MADPEEVVGIAAHLLGLDGHGYLLGRPASMIDVVEDPFGSLPTVGDTTRLSASLDPMRSELDAVLFLRLADGTVAIGGAGWLAVDRPAVAYVGAGRRGLMTDVTSSTSGFFAVLPCEGAPSRPTDDAGGFIDTDSSNDAGQDSAKDAQQDSAKDAQQDSAKDAQQEADAPPPDERCVRGTTTLRATIGRATLAIPITVDP